MATRLTVRQRFARKLPRLVKFGRLWVRNAVAPGRPDTRFVFVVGSQRSGTRLPIQALDHAPEVNTYSEGAAPFFDRVLLRPLDIVEDLRRQSVFPVVALKPICETHRVNELLDYFPRSRAVWIFRNYKDAVSSASAKWKSGREAVRRLASANPESAGWRLGGLSSEKLQLVRELYSDRMTLHDANAVMWYLRNGLFFDLAACDRPEVLLVRYEDFLVHPRESFTSMFAFIDVSLPSQIERAIHETGRAKPRTLDISAEIQRLCEELYERMTAIHRQRHSYRLSPALGENSPA